MLRALNLLLINLACLLGLFLLLEIAARAAHVVLNDGDFFRPPLVASPFFTTYDYPPPLIDVAGQARFRHRSEPTPLQKPAGTVRIITLGGSTTANERPYRQSGVDYAMALEAQLQRDDGRPVEVLNAGADAFSTAHSLVNLQLRLVEFAPDIVVLMHNINDASVALFGSRTQPDYANKYLSTYYINPQLQGSLSLAGLLTQSRLLTRLGVPQRVAGEARRDESAEAVADALTLFTRNLTSIARVARDNDIALLLLTQPFSNVADPWISDATLQRYNAAVLAVAQEQQMAVMDLATEFGQDATHFVDRVHYSPAGIDRLATLLAPEVNDLIEMRR